MPEQDYTNLQTPQSPYTAATTAKPPATQDAKPAEPVEKEAPLPVVQFSFFVCSSVTRNDIPQFAQQLVTAVSDIWKPRKDQPGYEDLKKYQVVSTWNQRITMIDDFNAQFRRIDFPVKDAPQKVLKLVNDNFSNPQIKPIIPVFICEAAWDEATEPGTPRDGALKAFTILNSLSWFKDERAILLFSKTAGIYDLAHELNHWCGFTDIDFRNNRANIGYAGGGGFGISKDQLLNYYLWVTKYGFRKALAQK